MKCTGRTIEEFDATVAARLAALSHPTRIAILRRLSLSGCCCCGEIVRSIDLAQSTVSQHLKVLVEAGLVSYRPDRQRSRYEIDRAAIAELSTAVSGLLGSCCAPAMIERPEFIHPAPQE